MKRFVLFVIMAIMAMMTNPSVSSAQDTVLADSAITVTCTGIGGDLVIQNSSSVDVWMAFVEANGNQETSNNRFSVSPTATNGPTTILGGTERLGEFLAVSVDQSTNATQWVRVECVVAEVSISCPIHNYLRGFVTVRGMWTDEVSVQKCFEAGDAGRSGFMCEFPEKKETTEPSYVDESAYNLSMNTEPQQVYAEFRIMDKTGLVVAKASETKVCEPAVVRSIDIGCETQIVEWASQGGEPVDVVIRTAVDGVADTTTLNGTNAVGTWVTPTPYDGTQRVSVVVFVYNKKGNLVGGLEQKALLQCYKGIVYTPIAGR